MEGSGTVDALTLNEVKSSPRASQLPLVDTDAYANALGIKLVWFHAIPKSSAPRPTNSTPETVPPISWNPDEVVTKPSSPTEYEWPSIVVILIDIRESMSAVVEAAS